MTSSGDDTLGQGSFGTWHVLPSTSMVDSVTGLRCAECSRAPDGARMPARSVCLVTLSLSEAGPGANAGRFGRQVSVTDILHLPCHAMPCRQT